MTTKAPARIALGIALVSSSSRWFPLLWPATAAQAANPLAEPPHVPTQSEPRVSIDNTWAWASPGSWGMPGQQLKYAIDVFNNDVGCGSSSFVVSVRAGRVLGLDPVEHDHAQLGVHRLRVGVRDLARHGRRRRLPADASRSSGRERRARRPSTSYYKVYSSDTVAPKLYWTNPADGGALSGRTTYVGFASSDDHAVKKLDLSSTAPGGATLCDNVSSDCQVSYKWSIRRVHGQHTATFRSTDWMGNVATQTATFTVN